ncbi:MAG: HD domain-containing protein [Deltaproteobacteria bacterium]|nr:HD domain-containing protein [Deltaproteobacteria bacterium]
MHIRDPIHGAIGISPAERRLLDTRAFQRLRHIKQLGFSDVAFPGATHTRFVHVVGAMHVSGLLFDQVFGRETGLPSEVQQRFRQALRLAVLSHDLGHPPLSHTSEFALPMLSTLGLPSWAVDDPGRRATHEDYTRLLFLDGAFAERLEALFPEGPGAAEVLTLLGGDPPEAIGAFVHGGIDYKPLLRQMVASELDADRMDYLRRDSLYAGVTYGQFDLTWLLSNLGLTVQGDAAYLALDRRAIFAFEDFLLSRYHMFLAVYFHRASVAYDEMLRRYFLTAEGAYQVPQTAAAFLETDDIDLYGVLRASPDEWARRIVKRQGYRTVYEEQSGDDPRFEEVAAVLTAAGISTLESESSSTVSRYLPGSRGLFVRTPGGEVPVDTYTPLFDRYAEAATIRRIYVPPEDEARARELSRPRGT